MILATFQPIDFENNTYEEHPATQKLKSELGIPLERKVFWCFPANNVIQACVRACNVNANYPEQLMIFKTDKYYAIDGVKQDLTTIIDNCDEIDIQNVDYKEYAEYLVTEIPVKRFSIPISSVKASAKKALETNEALIRACTVVESLKYVPMLPITTDDPSHNNNHQLLLIKNYINFILHAFPEVYECAMDYLGIEYKKIQRKVIPQDDISRIIASKSAVISAVDLSDLKRKFDMISRVAYDSFFAYEGVYPNDKCPCGSGKKYKKCCGMLSSLQTDLLDGVNI